MAKTTTTYLADASLTLIATCNKPVTGERYEASIQMGGTFGGGTLSLFISMDGGTTKNTLDNLSGTPYATAVAKTIEIDVALDNSHNGDVKIYGTLAGSTSPTLVVLVTDNN